MSPADKASSTLPNKVHFTLDTYHKSIGFINLKKTLNKSDIIDNNNNTNNNIFNKINNLYMNNYS